MKHILIISLSFLWLTPVVFAQKAKKEYVNASLEKVKKKEATLYRLTSQNSDKTWRSEYFKILADELILVVNYKTEALETKHGLTRTYRDGKLSAEQEFSNGVTHGVYRKHSNFGKVLTEGQYKQGSKDGDWKEFYANGSPRTVENYYNGKSKIITKIWTREGTLMLEGEVKDGKKDGLWTYYFNSGKELRKVNYSKGSKNGLSQEWFKNGRMKLEESYQNGKLHGAYKRYSQAGVLVNEGTYVEGQKSAIWNSYDEDGTLGTKMDYSESPAKVLFISEKRKQGETTEVIDMGEIVEVELEEPQEVSEETVFLIVEQGAEPLGGMHKLIEHVFKYLQKHYPEKAKKAGVQGTIYLNFVIEKDGTPSTFKILKGLGHGCDKVAIEAIKSYGKWTPAKQRGRIVRQRFNFPVKFRI